MVWHAFLTIILCLLSINAVVYLKSYFILTRKGIKAYGSVISYETSRFIMIKNTLIPKLKFLTSENISIIGKPLHSWFIELNDFTNKKEHVIFYSKENPNIFIVKSNIELFSNIVMILSALISSIILFASTIQRI